MKRTGWLAVLVASCLAFAACSSSSSGGGGGGLNGGSPTTKADNVCAKTKSLTASETGITASTITVTVMADVGSPLSPGLFQGSMDGVNAWADSVNAAGGLACRKVVVKEVDSKLSPDEAKNGLISACGDSLTLLGTTSLFLNNMKPAESCKDKAGQPVGIPDLAVLQTEPVEQCSPISFAVIPQTGSCPYSGTGPRTYTTTTPAITWLKKNVSSDLHGVFVVAQDVPSTITSSVVLFTSIQKNGVKQDAEFGASGLFTQSQYTPIVQSIKSHKSTWGLNGLDFAGTLKMRKEAAAQGVNTVKVWACSLQCYAPGFIAQGGSAVEDQYSWIPFLPFEDKGTNDALDTFLQYDKKPDSFGVQAFASGMLLKQSIDAIVKKDGPNGITRQGILDQLNTVHDFNAGGMMVPTDVAGKKPSNCTAIVQVKGGAWVRVDPTKKGTFDCDQPGGETVFTIDALKAYKPS